MFYSSPHNIIPNKHVLLQQSLRVYLIQFISTIINEYRQKKQLLFIQLSRYGCCQMMVRKVWVLQSVVGSVCMYFNSHGDGEEDAILQIFHKSKDQLNEANFINIGNLQGLTNNLQFLFKYGTEAFKAITEYTNKIKEANQKLLSIVQKEGLIGQIDEEIEELQYNYELDRVNLNMREDLAQKNDEINRNAMEKQLALQKKRKTMEKINMGLGYQKKQQVGKGRNEYIFAINFVRTFLQDKLQEQSTKTLQLPKNAILNLYIQWNEKKGIKIPFNQLANIQMALTTEIRKKFTNVMHNQKCFRGLQFKEEYKDLMKTDIKVRKDMREDEVLEQPGSSQDLSPELPCFPDDPRTANR